MLAPENLVGRAHAIMLNGGSVFGLAANGAMAARQEFELGRAGAGRGAMADLITGGLGSAAADCLAHTIAGAV